MPIKTSLSRLSKNPLIWSLISLAFLCAYLLFLLNKTPEEKPLIAELALTQSIIRGDLVAAQTLLADENNEEDIHETDALGRTALHIAAFYGQTEIAAFLLEKGIAIENTDEIGMRALHAAALSGGRAMTQFLIEHGALIDAQSNAGQSALHLAAATGQPKLSQLLLEFGANSTLKDQSGKTPEDYARQNKHPITMKTLREFKATLKTPENKEDTIS